MTQPLKWIIRTDEPFRGIAQSFTYLDNEGVERVAYTGFTLEEYANDREYTFRLVTNEELDAMIEKHEKAMIEPPRQIKEGDYYYALEVLPPCRFNNSLFHMSERIQGDIVSWYFKKGDKFYTFVNKDSLTDEELKEIVRSA